MPFEVDKENPFKNDCLNRKEAVAVLTQLIKNIDEPFVLGVDSGWGTGKTTFIKMWMYSLEKEGFPCLYFNAWENDFSDDPLVSLIGEMQGNLESLLGKPKDPKARKLFDKTKKIGYEIAKKSIPLAIKVATSGVVDLAGLAEKEIPEFFSTLAKEKIENYEKQKNTLTNFKEHLQEFVSELTQKEKESQKKLMFFIDELDRCRPTFAIELLEKVKHLFSVNGIIFVLSIDRKQLIHAISSVYGIGMDADGYLRRFIDLSYRLPQAATGDFIFYLLSRFELDKYLDVLSDRHNNQKEQFTETFIRLSAMFNLSLRVQEQCFTRFTIALQTFALHQFVHPVFLAFLIIIKAAKPELYESLSSGEKSGWEVVNELKGLPKANSFFDAAYGRGVEVYLILSTYRHNEPLEGYQHYQKVFEDPSRSEPEKERARKIVSMTDIFVQRDWTNTLSYLVKKIEVTESFLDRPGE